MPREGICGHQARAVSLPTLPSGGEEQAANFLTALLRAGLPLRFPGSGQRADLPEGATVVETEQLEKALRRRGSAGPGLSARVQARALLALPRCV